MTINGKSSLCNMAVSHLGNYGSVLNIDTPTTDIEIICSLWYDIARETFLKMTIPNFSMGRRDVAQLAITPPYPFGYAYEYPSDCLKVLGIGAVEDKRNNYTVEDNKIYTNILYEGGMPLRFIRNVKDVSRMSTEFKVGFSWYLASLIALPVTQDVRKAESIEAKIPMKMAALSGVNAQENKPIRISRSRFKEARISSFPQVPNKR